LNVCHNIEESSAASASTQNMLSHGDQLSI